MMEKREFFPLQILAFGRKGIVGKKLKRFSFYKTEYIVL